YKSKKFIEGKIQDLLDQTIGNQLEIIIIDSNSPENERAIVAKYIQKHKNIKFIRTKKRETLYQAWNRGIQEAHGKFITNANTDDRLKPDAFEILVDELNSNSDIALVYGDFFITNRGNQDFCDHIRCGYSIKPEYSPDIMLSGCHMGPFPMWRKSLHDEIGYFDENLQSAGDYEFWCRLATKYSMKHINKFIGLYYHKPKGIVNRAEDKSKNETGLIKEKYKDKFPPPSGKTATGYYYKDQVGKNKYVNISMVTYNRLDFTKQAIASVLKNTRYPHVITVVDNGSTDGSREYLKKMHQKGIIKNILLLDENVGVSKASNLAWKMESDAEYYLKLDNDIVIFKTDWLSAMIQMVDAIPQIGAIAYNFEVQSYPLTEIGGLRCRVKAEGNLGGACILIPKRIREQLGYWCEEYGLYGEEDADYDFRIKCKGLLNVYMEDENIGFHLPGGKAAVIDPHTFTAADGQEEIQQADYRKWKDEMRRNNVTKGKFYKNLNDYSKGIRSLFAESKFADQYFKQKGISTELNDPIERKEEKICESKVSIIIPVFNQLAFTKKCLNAIFRNTPSDLFEIIIIDNASTDETVRYLSDLGERIKLITNNQNMGFAKACNQGAQKASGKYLLFLNNDTEVQPEWLNALVEVLDKDKSVAAVGSKMLFPDKKIQHAGVAIVNNQKIRDPLFAQHIYYQQAENYPQANQISTYQALTAACMLVRRSAFEAVDRFDERYWNGYEDIDLCFKFQKRGWLLIYQPTSVVIHYESQSGPERFNRVQHNIERLHQKWLGKINPDLMIETNGTEIETGAGCIRPYQIETFANRQRIDSTKSIKQLTSIVILTCNQIEYTKKCIDSIYKQTPEPFELILVDNGSTDGTVQYLESEIADRNEAIRVKIIKNKKNKGFAAGNNQGIAIAKGDYILLMNNDVVVTPGWLGRMIACAEKDSKIGIVGPCSNYVSGPQLVEKVNYDVNTLKGLTEFSNQFAAQHSQQEQQILRVVGFCMLIKRAVIEAVGGMDNRYGLGNFEDDDFSLRATIAGFKSCIASDSFIHHFGSRTFVGENIDYRNSLTKNWELFKEKWGLPFELPYGSPYSLSQMKHTLFDPIVHYYPLQEEDYSTMNFDDHLSKVEDLYAGIEKQFKTMSTNEAIAEIEKLLANHPEFAIGYNDLGVLHYQVGNKEDSLKNYETAVRLDPENITFKKNLADFYFVEIGQVDAALRIYIEVLEKNPKDIEILLITGHICVALHKFEDAKVFYRRVLELEPYNEDAQNNLTKLEKMPLMTSAYNSAEEMYQEIQPLLNNGDQHKAIASLGKLLERFPDFTLAHNDLGVLYYYTGDKEKAQHHYERAVELTPDNINFQKNLADFYCIELGRIEDALKIYVSILTTDPQDVETLMATGQICKALEKFDDARDFFNQVLQIEPWNADARKQMEEMERPMPGASLNSESTEDAYRRLQEKLNALTPAQAVVELEKLVESYPEFAVGHNDLGVLYYNTGNKEKALHHYRQAANLQPENMTLQKNLADFLFVELEKVEEALQIYVDILASHPDDVETLLISGHICVALKKFDDAKDFYERVLTLEPDNQDAKKNLQALIDRQSERLSARPDSLNDVTVSSAKVEAADLNTEEFENQDADHQPIVSIIISLEGIQNRVKQCIESITAHTEESHEIILINSGATKGVLKWAQNIVQDNAHYQLLKCDKMHNWAQGLNQAVKAAAGEYIVLMHNDVMVADRWLSSMLQCFRAGSAIGIVGPMTNETSGIQKAYFSDDRDPNLLESDAKAFYAQNQYQRIPTTRLASFFLMFRHELTDKIGDFDAQLVSEQAVVVDFCKRSAAGGFQNLVAGDVFVYHADRHKGSRKTSDAVQVPAEDQKRLKENWNKTAGDQRFLKGIQMTSLLETVNKLHQKGYLNQAVETLLNAIGAIPEETRLYLALAEISIALRRYQDAIDTLNEMPADAKT
ncbi:MAG: glycosyltransferase, partial [Desulfobacterales bacterium]|nr:glycosyltransferase [Desulfobacterales bacterium]